MMAEEGPGEAEVRRGEWSWVRVLRAVWVGAVGVPPQPKGPLHLTGFHLTQSSSGQVLSRGSRVEMRQCDSPGPHLAPVPPWAVEGVKKLSLWGDPS